MEREDAAVILSTLVAGFHNEVLERETVDLWTDELAELDDRNAAAIVARGIVRNGERFPSIARFRAGYLEECRRTQNEGAATRGLPESRETEVPEWVHVWWWARRYREGGVDDRPFPQQHGLGDPLAEMSEHQFMELRAEWLAAGAPKVTAAQIAGAARPMAQPLPPDVDPAAPSDVSFSTLLGEHPAAAVASPP